MLSPVKSLLDAGALVSYEGEEGTENPFNSLETLVRRQTARGHVLGEREKVDRRTALRIMTENGAKYVLKEKEIGSIEVGKWGDLIVIDRNPLDRESGSRRPARRHDRDVYGRRRQSDVRPHEGSAAEAEQVGRVR